MSAHTPSIDGGCADSCVTCERARARELDASAKRAAKKRKPVASAESFDELVNEICAFHGFRREKWDANRHVVFGLRGPAGRLALDLIKAFKATVRDGSLPKIDKESKK